MIKKIAFAKKYANACSIKPFKTTKWMMPEGNKIGLSIHNCVAGEKVPVVLNDSHIATWYSCGPTVYDSPHIGHASCYVKLDIIQRILRHFLGVKLVTSMGITDIDDKIIKKAKETSVNFEIIAKKYEHEFWMDMSKLAVEKPAIITRVSDNIPVIIKFVQKLIDSNLAYVTSDGSVYFDTEKYSDYGKLQKMQESYEPSNMEKKFEADFALWKGSKPGEPYWETNWGRGRPGWHIECSAMVSNVFGPQVDFHAGGIDLQFPHHENEECQSCAYHKVPQWTNYWIHVGHLHIKNDVKMSKSIKNTISINEMLEKHSSDSFRMACLLSNYKNSMEYSEEMMENASSVLNKFKYFLKTCSSYVNNTERGGGVFDSDLVYELKNVQQTVEEALKDDFDTSKCVNAMLTLVSKLSKVFRDDSDNYYPIPVLLAADYIKSSLFKLGVALKDDLEDSTSYPNTIMDALVELRHVVRLNAMARKDKDLLLACDIARDKLKTFNIKINDSSKNSTWIKAK